MDAGLPEASSTQDASATDDPASSAPAASSEHATGDQAGPTEVVDGVRQADQNLKRLLDTHGDE
eukprot:5470674-Alexandrium_andersonii.AAC.1